MHCLCQVVCEFSLQQDVCELKNCELQNLELFSLLYLCDTSTCYRYQVIGSSCQGASKVHLAPSKLGSDPWPKIWQAKLMKQISIYYPIFLISLFVLLINTQTSFLRHFAANRFIQVSDNSWWIYESNFQGHCNSNCIL
jgi:hypothetical protein